MSTNQQPASTSKTRRALDRTRNVACASDLFLGDKTWLRQRGKKHPVDYYLNSLASDSDEYASDTPSCERVPLSKNARTRYLTFFNRSKDCHQWKQDPSKADLEEVRAWSERVSSRLKSFDILNSGLLELDLGCGIGAGRKEEEEEEEEEEEGNLSLAETQSDSGSRLEKGKKKKKTRRESEVTDCESSGNKEKKKKKRSESEVEDCNNPSESGSGKKKKRREKDFNDSGTEDLVSGVNRWESSRRDYSEEGVVYSERGVANMETSDCGDEEKVGRSSMFGSGRGGKKRVRQSESGSEDGGGRMSDERRERKRRRKESGSEVEVGSRVVALKDGEKKRKKDSLERDVNSNESPDKSSILLKSSRKSLDNRSVSTIYSEKGDVSTYSDHGRERSKGGENLVRSKHSISEDEDSEKELDEDGGMIQLMNGNHTRDVNHVSDSELTLNDGESRHRKSSDGTSRVQKSPTKVPNNLSRNTGSDSSSESTDDNVDFRNGRDKNCKSSAASESQKDNLDNYSDYRLAAQNKKQSDDENFKKNLKTSPKKSCPDIMSQDIFEQESSNSDSDRKGSSDKSNSKGISSDAVRNNMKSNIFSKVGDNRSDSESSSDSGRNSSGKKHKLEASTLVVDDYSTKPVTKPSKTVVSKEKSINNGQVTGLLAKKVINSDVDADSSSQDIFKTPIHLKKKTTATSTPFQSQMTKQNLEQAIDISAISKGSKAGSSDSESCSGYEESVVNVKASSYSRKVIPKILKRIEKKLLEGIQEEYFEEDLFYVEDLSDNDEVWVAPCPKSLKISSLVGRELNLSGCTDLPELSTNDEGEKTIDYEAFATPIGGGVKGDGGEQVVFCLQPSRNRRQVQINPLKLAGRISIEEKIRIPSPNNVELTTSMKLVLPENLKTRHPLLGAEFKNQPKTFDSLDESASFSSHRSKKKKKKKSRTESEKETTITSLAAENTSFAETCHKESSEKKKKEKKKRHRDEKEEENNVVLSSHQEEFKNQPKTFDSLDESASFSSHRSKKKKKKRSRTESEKETTITSLAAENTSFAETCHEESPEKKKKKKKRHRDEEENNVVLSSQQEEFKNQPKTFDGLNESASSSSHRSKKKKKKRSRTESETETTITSLAAENTSFAETCHEESPEKKKKKKKKRHRDDEENNVVLTSHQEDASCDVSSDFSSKKKSKKKKRRLDE